MTDARRPLLALAFSIAGIALLPAGASALGPGGWDHVGDGGGAGVDSLNATASSLNSDLPGVLLVGGGFTNAGGIADADRIATWNGSAWGALSSAGSQISNGSVNAIAYAGGKVYAGGTFLDAGGNANADYLAVWDGASWAPFCTSAGTPPTFEGNVNALEVIGSTLYVGGSFQNGADIAEADYVLACDLNTGASSSTVAVDGHFSGSVYALAADSGGLLYAAGTFTNVQTNVLTDFVASYDGAGTWSPLGTGPGANGEAVTGISRSLTASGTNVYVGSDAVNIGSEPFADHVAKWDGADWVPLGSNTAATDGWFTTTTSIYGLVTDGTAVYATGSFQNADGNALADNVAAFNGSAWLPVGSNGAGNGPWVGDGLALALFNSQLVAAGGFTSAGGDVDARGIACYLQCTFPPAVVVQPQPTLASATGQRAAALKKCKKKRTAKTRKKCKQKARRLPV